MSPDAEYIDHVIICLITPFIFFLCLICIACTISGHQLLILTVFNLAGHYSTCTVLFISSYQLKQFFAQQILAVFSSTSFQLSQSLIEPIISSNVFSLHLQCLQLQNLDMSLTKSLNRLSDLLPSYIYIRTMQLLNRNCTLQHQLKPSMQPATRKFAISYRHLYKQPHQWPHNVVVQTSGLIKFPPLILRLE